ncbi:hypothetical protein H072_10524 [Dactylellina haptotyla CBS 200.50]|uniref:WSC domain-containing protein n=1 Tax=Dactylellina haptotyla (strain CBS 200.50) TaxID=1284197 RepID=S8A4M5_DACHA|nr:hypothetical protein H072_10524 [Dactylellina haptotyla CBS 200.50]
MQIKALLLAFAASSLATAVPSEQKNVEKRDYGYAGGYCATKYVTKTKTTTCTKWSKTSTKWTTKYSTKYATRTSTKTSTKTTTKTSTKTNTSTKTTTKTVSGSGTTVTASFTVTTTVSGTSQPTSTGPRFAGCYLENTANNHILQSASKTDATGMTVEICQDNCFGAGFSFAGITNGTICACGNGFADSWSETLDDSGCAITCPGNSAETCGGTGAFEVYVSAVSATAVGCYADTGNKSVLSESYSFDPQMTIEMCQTKCFNEEYTFAAVRDGTSCYCNDGFENPPLLVGTSSDCQVPCGGNTAEFCGGNGYLSVFALTR